RLKIVTRSSNLAIKQVEEVMVLLPNVTYGILKIQSYGDKHKEISLFTNTPTDFFTRELDEAILSGEGDIAIHSAKDLPYPLPAGLDVIALTDSPDQTDCLISNDNKKLNELVSHARVGTSSEQRKEQLLSIRPDLSVVSIRGSIDERIELVRNKQIDALIAATCAIKRLGLSELITEILPFKTNPLQGQLSIIAKKENFFLRNLFSPIDCRKKYGKVYIAGFGPGDPELLTIKAQHALQQADIIFYDSLLDDIYLANFKGEKIKVGKRKDMHLKEQDEINELLYKAAISGKLVVRIKGGDPMIFGRGGEEFCYLKERLIDVEIIPGITSAFAASAIAGIPLTQRDISSSVAFCTGHPESSIHIPDTDTIVFYMSASNLHIILNKLIEAGRPTNTPVALIENISLPEQLITTGTLYEILKKTNTFHSPLLVIVGNTVMLNHSIKRSVPRVLITGTSVEKYRHLGDIVHTPLIELNTLTSFEELDPVIQKINEFTYLIFTSRYAVQYFFNRLFFLHSDSRILAGIKIASIGKITSVKLAEYGIIPDLEAKDESSRGLIDLFREKKITCKTILIPRSNKGLSMLPDGLSLLGNHVKTVTVYKNEIPSDYKKVDLNDFDIVVFSSPSCVINFKTIYGDEIPSQLEFIAKGDETARTIEQVSLINNK
nr:uroporphyrinogen-III C-methyltransferase [Bacteroidota bacterium]